MPVFESDPSLDWSSFCVVEDVELIVDVNGKFSEWLGSLLGVGTKRIFFKGEWSSGLVRMFGTVDLSSVSGKLCASNANLPMVCLLISLERSGFVSDSELPEIYQLAWKLLF